MPITYVIGSECEEDAMTLLFPSMSSVFFDDNVDTCANTSDLAEKFFLRYPLSPRQFKYVEVSFNSSLSCPAYSSLKVNAVASNHICPTGSCKGTVQFGRLVKQPSAKSCVYMSVVGVIHSQQINIFVGHSMTICEIRVF